jgi:hypothetical protein
MTHLVSLQYESLRKQLDVGLPIALDGINRLGGFSRETATAAWSATDQVSGGTEQLTLPRIDLGSSWLGQATNPTGAYPAIDDLARATGATVAVYQLDGTGTGLLSVASSGLTADGKSLAIGTLASTTGADGSADPFVAAALAGKEYRGPAQIGPTWAHSCWASISSPGVSFAARCSRRSSAPPATST